MAVFSAFCPMYKVQFAPLAVNDSIVAIEYLTKQLTPIEILACLTLLIVHETSDTTRSDIKVPK